MSSKRRRRKQGMSYTRKIQSREVLLRNVKAQKLAGNKVVFTNGVFDILHPGHIRYLDAASMLGNTLVVAVNGDESARRLAKGPRRPINYAVDRAEVLSALKCVSYITIFEEDTPYELIKLLVPDVLVKGGDWPVEEIAGADIVTAGGGEVLSLPFEEGYSTTDLIERIIAPAPAEGGQR